MDSSSASPDEYSRWGCVYFQPPEHTQLRYEISRAQLASKIANGEFRDLPVDVGHASEVATVGRVTDAVQAKTNGSVFVRVTVKPGTLESDFAVSMMRNGQIRGLSLQHDAGTDERKLLAVGVTPKPRRPNTFLLPEGIDPLSSTKRRNGSTIVSFSAFDSLDIYGDLDASSQNPNASEADAMSSTPSTPATPATQPATQPQTDAKPAATQAAPKSAASETKGVMLDGEVATPEEIKALVDFARKTKQELEETKRAMMEKENLLKPVLEEQKSKALKLMQAFFDHGVAAVSEAEKKEIEETQSRLMGLVEKDPQLLARIARFSSTEQKTSSSSSAPVRDRDAMGRFVSSSSQNQNQNPNPAHHDAQPPREDRRSSKRTRSVDEMMGDYSSSSSTEGLGNKLSLREPETKDQPRQLHPALRDILGATALEQRRAVAYSAASADQTQVYEQYERNRVEALRGLNMTGAGTTLLATTEFPNLRSYEDYLRSGAV